MITRFNVIITIIVTTDKNMKYVTRLGFTAFIFTMHRFHHSITTLLHAVIFGSFKQVSSSNKTDAKQHPAAINNKHNIG